MLLECEPETTQLQAVMRGFIQRQETSRIVNHLQLAEPSIIKVQALLRGVKVRKEFATEKQSHSEMRDWAVAIQARSRALRQRTRFEQQRDQLRDCQHCVVGLQAHARGSLVRSCKRKRSQEIIKAVPCFIAIQAAIRGAHIRKQHVQIKTDIAQPSSLKGIVGLQAVVRTRLAQRNALQVRNDISTGFAHVDRLQALVRGALFRKTLRVQVQTLDNSTDQVVAIQAAARGALARRKKQVITVQFDRVEPNVVSLQTLMRAKLATKAHKDMKKALSKVEVASSIGGFQSMLRSKLASKKTQEQKKKLEFVQPDVIGFQAQARGVLARRDYKDWLEYLVDEETQEGITFCQQLLRGHLARQRYWGRLAWYYNNVRKIIKVQAIWRGRKQRDQYRKIISGQDVDIPAIQSFMHLLDDSEVDFAEEIRVEQLRKKVIENIQLNQTLESQVTELDTKIALILQNRLTFEELVKVKGLAGAVAPQQQEQSFTVANSDPFSHSATLEKSSRKKLELYQQLFFLLQTQPKYLARLIRLQTTVNVDDQGRRLLQDVVLALYSYGQSRREEYLLLKLLQVGRAPALLQSAS